MGMIDPIIMELRHEGGTTRKVIERIPEDKLNWRPHQKSMTMGGLASHLAETFAWTEAMVDTDEYVMDPEYKPVVYGSKDEILEAFDAHLAKAIDKLTDVPDDQLMVTWSMKQGDQTVFQMPRIAVIRSMLLSHQFHHRGQLTVYLRLNDVPVPQVYGPTADEPVFSPAVAA